MAKKRKNPEEFTSVIYHVAAHVSSARTKDMSPVFEIIVSPVRAKQVKVGYERMEGPKVLNERFGKVETSESTSRPNAMGWALEADVESVVARVKERFRALVARQLEQAMRLQAVAEIEPVVQTMEMD